MDGGGRRVNNVGSGDRKNKGNQAMRVSPKITLAVLAVALSLPAAAGTADPIVKRMLDAKGTKYTIDDDGDYKVVIEYSDDHDRTQLVYIRSAIETYQSHRVREIWSAAYKSPSDKFSSVIANRLLEASHEMKLGSWVKQDRFAVFVVKLPAEASADDLRSAVSYAAGMADEMEKELTDGGDDY
jgi:hypothetical protein